MAGHALLQPFGPFPGPAAHLALYLLGFHSFQLGHEPPVFGTLLHSLGLQMELVEAVSPLVAATGAHPCRSEAILGQLDIVPRQLSTCGSREAAQKVYCDVRLREQLVELTCNKT